MRITCVSRLDITHLSAAALHTSSELHARVNGFSEYKSKQHIRRMCAAAMHNIRTTCVCVDWGDGAEVAARVRGRQHAWEC